jgi:putative tricarboxylic transport membrane protein
MTTRGLFRIGSLVVLAGAATLFVASAQMPYATSLGPGPGFLPYWLSAILFGLGCAMLVQAPRDLPADFRPAEGGVMRMLAILGAVALAALGLNVVGFAPVMLAANLLVLLALGFRRPLALAAVALANSFGIYYAFLWGLGVQLPAGLLPG